jgi:hypothetical protein
VEAGIGISRQRDQAQGRVVGAEPGHCADAVQPRHVQVDHDRIRAEAIGELDRGESVVRGADDDQTGLPVDQRPEGLDEQFVVVGEQDADPAVAGSGPLHRDR